MKTKDFRLTVLLALSGLAFLVQGCQLPVLDQLTHRVSQITVSGEGGLSTITTPKGTLQAVAKVLPTDAANSAVSWSVIGGGGSATISASGLVTAVSDGNVTVVATAQDGSQITGQMTVTISGQTQTVRVTTVSISAPGGITAITTNGGTLQFTATVTPTTATNPGVTWTAVDGTGTATISSTGLLTATANGTVTVRATAQDGSGVFGEAVVVISGQGKATTNGLVGRYTFDDGTAKDTSGAGADGVVSGAVLTTDRFGQAGKAFEFSGPGHHISLPDLARSSGFSATLWVRSSAAQGTYGYPLNSRSWDSQTPGLVYAGVQAGGTAVDTYGNLPLDSYSVGLFHTQTPWVGNGVWHQLSVTFDAATKTTVLCVDGQTVATRTFSTYPSAFQPRIELGGAFQGSTSAGSARNWLGSIDDVGLYNRALSSAELLQIYNQEKPATVTTGSLPIDLAHWSKNVTKSQSPALTMGTYGLVLGGAPHGGQDGNGAVYTSALDLRNKTVSTKYMAQTSSYLWTKSYPVDIATGLQICPISVNATTDHSFNGTIVIPKNTWVYEEWTFAASTWTWKLATGDYPSRGGTLLTNQSGSLTSSDFANLGKAYWGSNFGDNYGGSADSLVLAEVAVK